MSKKSDLPKKMLRTFLTGFGMGSADIVPGVSGGTIAFIFGIYEELIFSIKQLSGTTIKLMLRGRIKEAFYSVPFTFLAPLGVGILGAIVTLSKLISYLLNTYPSFLWAFFFGLVIASIVLVSRRIVSWNNRDLVTMVVAAVAAYFVVGAVPVETPDTYPLLFLSGAIAICAMILPGISGSFLLLIMGKYEQVLSMITTRDLTGIAIFGFGAVVGLALFSRLLSWMFRYHHDIVVAALTGIMLGSLRKLWPWKEVLQTRINSHGEMVPLVEANILPDWAALGTYMAIFLVFVGMVLILTLEKFNGTKEKTEDIESKSFAKEHEKALKLQKE